MSNLRTVLLVSTLTLAACGSGSSSNSSAPPPDGFNGSKTSKLQLAEVELGRGIGVGYADDVSYNPQTKRLSGRGFYNGTITEGRTTDDGKDHLILVTNPDRTNYVRRFVQTNRATYDVRIGVMGFETERMPRTGTLAYKGTSTGVLGTSDGTERDFTARVGVKANTRTGRGTFEMTDVSAVDGRQIGLKSVKENIVIEGSEFSSAQDGSLKVTSTGSQSLGRAVDGMNAGKMYGPLAQEVGGAYLYRTRDAAMVGNYTGKR